MIKRTVTSIIALAVFALILVLPSGFFAAALAAVIFFMLYECYSATKTDNGTRALGFFSAAILMAAVYLCRTFRLNYISAAISIIGLFLIIASYMIMIVVKHGKKNYGDVISSGFLTMYIVLSMGCVWITKEMYGTAQMLLTFICAWSCDTFAYLSGRLFGRHKLIPKVSPNKTVEGSVGGVIGAVVICTAYLFFVKDVLNTEIWQWSNLFVQGAVCGLIGGIFAQIGDLIASAIKRDAGIKDFGWIFPGHGGFMDRFDSVIFIAPIMCAIPVIIDMIMLAAA